VVGIGASIEGKHFVAKEVPSTFVSKYRRAAMVAGIAAVAAACFGSRSPVGSSLEL